jgi:putative membrane protein
MRRMSVMAVAMAAVIAVGCNRSDNRAANDSAVGTAGRANNGVSAGDRDFVRDVATMNMAEIELSRTALQRSGSADVKEFAQMMVADHPKAGEKLKAVAAQHQIEVPAQLDDKHRDQGEKVAAKQGLDFDKEYADAMVDGHQDFVDKLESRIDKDTLSKWKAGRDGNRSADYGAANRPAGSATPANPNAAQPNPDAKVEAMAVTAEKSDNPVTQGLNQWAAETYAVAYAHLEAAKALRDGVRKRSTN